MNIWKRSWVWNGQRHHAWRVDWKDSAGRHQRQFRSKVEADLFREKLIKEKHSREYGVLLESSFPDFVNIYEAKKPWRTESYRDRVMSALHLMPFTQFPTAGRSRRIGMSGLPPRSRPRLSARTWPPSPTASSGR